MIEAKDLSRQTILIVDDSPVNIKMLGETLMSDYEISVTTNGPEAVEIAGSEKSPDLILLDIMMPDMDGYEVCRILKRDPQTKSIPIIFITARTQEEEETKGFRLGAVDYITKPFSPEIVKARVRTHLDLKIYRDHLEDLVREQTEDLRKSRDELEIRVEERTAELSRSNALLKQEIIERERSEAALKENEEYLRTIMATIQTGVIIIDPRTRKIIDANPWAAKMVGLTENDLLGMSCRDLSESLEEDEAFNCLMPGFCESIDGDDCILRTETKERIHVRRSFAKAQIRDNEYYVHSLLDITDIKHLLKKQEVSIDLAKNLLRLVNDFPPRYIDLPQDLVLFVDAVSLPCYAEGGDHFFVRNAGKKNKRTFLSIKDQSGHEVSCVLRSIITDLVHNTILNRYDHLSIEENTSLLNDRICRSETFHPEDFFTAMNAVIDHDSLTLGYVSAGHPPFLLIRNGSILDLPEPGGSGINIPLAFREGMPYSAGRIDLERGDQLIFYTDGLTEMPLAGGGKMISTEGLKEMASLILMEKGKIPVSRLMREILAKTAEISNEEVLPEDVRHGPKNTSGDDITLLCLELESSRHQEETKLYCENGEKVSEWIVNLYSNLESSWNEKAFEAPDIRLRLVFEEAVLNAWKHGNREDPEKSIIIRWRFGNDFTLEVIDEGPGFDFRRLPDPTIGDNRVKPSGRGIFIIRQFADFVDWKDEGRHVVIGFRQYANPNGNRPHPIRLWESF